MGQKTRTGEDQKTKQINVTAFQAEGTDLWQEYFAPKLSPVCLFTLKLSPVYLLYTTAIESGHCYFLMVGWAHAHPGPPLAAPRYLMLLDVG